MRPLDLTIIWATNGNNPINDISTMKKRLLETLFRDMLRFDTEIEEFFLYYRKWKPHSICQKEKQGISHAFT